jgi:tetratricopeptide (TPR) repeat protein
MITENQASLAATSLARPSDRAKAILPWIIAGGAMLIYLVTLNRWMSFNSVQSVARTSGWAWQPEIWPFTQQQPAPLYWLITYPLRWLPVTAIPIALNLLSVVFAGLTLALLARSVALLPHDRTHAQRLREKGAFGLLSLPSAWLPPLLATLLCGLQLTFWEHATVASADMLNLLLFAYVIRALLEFRVDGGQSWLWRAAFIYGLGIANDWAFIGFFPVFLAAVIWIKGLGFFHMRFLIQMCLWGLAGLLLYLLLPLTQSLSEIGHMPFWTALRANVGGQKLLLGMVLNKQMLLHADKPFWVLGIASLLPLLVMGIKWPSYSGDTSPLGVAIASFTSDLFHGILWILCLWVALDPPMSPRFHVQEALRPWLPMLTLYYLGALGAGYFTGYFLLVFSKKIERPRRPQVATWAAPFVTGGVCLVSILMASALVCRNLAQIRATNGPAVKGYAALMAEGLPKGPAIILSDDPRNLALVEETTAQSGQFPNYLFLDSTSLKWPEYHRFLKKRFPQLWHLEDEIATRQKGLEDGAVLQLIWNLSESNRLYYLHPSFGYYFETFYPEPHGLIYELKRFPPETLLAPLPSHELTVENEAFWQAAKNTTFAALRPFLSPAEGKRSTRWLDKIAARAHLLPQANSEISVIAKYCSRALNVWGVQMQKQQQFPQAGSHFQSALELNPDNVAAHINLECNKNLQAGRKNLAELPNSIEDRFGKYRKWEQVMNANGPFDQPTFCFEQGRVFARAGLYRQAAEQFARAVALAPDNVAARLMLSQLYLIGRMPDSALKLVGEIHAMSPAVSLSRSNQIDLLYIELSLHLAKGDLPAAQAAFDEAMARFPKDEDLLATATHVFMNTGRYTNALAAVDQQLLITPDNPSALVNKGFALMQFHEYEKAIGYFTKALSVEPGLTSALFNRAISYLRLDKLDDAKRDYEQLQKSNPTAFQINFGLAEIALRKKDTNAAILNYELYLTNSPSSNVEEANLVRARLAQLKSAAR